MVERHFDDELARLDDGLLKMAALVENAIQKAIEALKNQNKNTAQEVIDKDKKIDALELEIEQKAIEMLALYQPIARDLRFVLTTGVKLNAELERIADLAVNVAQRVQEIADQPLIKPLIDIPKLADLARSMVKDAIDAYVKRDQELARKVILRDTEADKIRNMICDELIYDYMAKDVTIAPRAVPLFLVARHLERICDHATYIAEDVIYMVKAKVVKHHTEELDKNGS